MYESFQISKQLPIFLHLLRRDPGSTVITLKKMTMILKPLFSAEGSNARKYEGDVYAAFLKYMREAASKL